MQASRPRRTSQPDVPWQTICWLGAAAGAWWFVQPGSPIPLVWTGFLAPLWICLLIRASVRAHSPLFLFLLCWICFTVTWSISLSWVRHVSVAGWLPLAAYSASYAALLALLMRWSLKRIRVVPISLLAGVFGLSLEYIRAEVLFDAWPFHLAGHAFWGSAVTGLAQWGGVWACSLLAFSVGGLGGAVLLRRTNRRWALESLLPATLLVLAMMLNLWPAQPVPGLVPVSILGLQTNLPQNNKMAWTESQQAEDVAEFIAQTRQGLSDADSVDLVVWPETMVPGIGFEPETLRLLDMCGPAGQSLARWPRELTQQAILSQVPWLVGTTTWTEVRFGDGRLVPEKRFNSAALLDPDGSLHRVDKIFLTPFGETMPYVRAWPWLEQKVLDVGASGMSFNLDAAEEPAILDLQTTHAGDWSIAVPICFEDAVPSVTRKLCVSEGTTVVDLIINISNDGWFGDSDAGRASHAVSAAFRAIELGRPLLRVANTGESALVLPDGRMPAVLPVRDSANLFVKVPRYEGTTFQARWGNWLPRLMLLIAVTIGVFSVRVD